MTTVYKVCQRHGEYDASVLPMCPMCTYGYGADDACNRKPSPAAPIPLKRGDHEYYAVDNLVLIRYEGTPEDYQLYVAECSTPARAIHIAKALNEYSAPDSPPAAAQQTIGRETLKLLVDESAYEISESLQTDDAESWYEKCHLILSRKVAHILNRVPLQETRK